MTRVKVFRTAGNVREIWEIPTLCISSGGRCLRRGHDGGALHLWGRLSFGWPGYMRRLYLTQSKKLRVGLRCWACILQQVLYLFLGGKSHHRQSRSSFQIWGDLRHVRQDRPIVKLSKFRRRGSVEMAPIKPSCVNYGLFDWITGQLALSLHGIELVFPSTVKEFKRRWHPSALKF